MTFSPKVWGDALRRLQDEIPDFAFDAWIAPLAVKLVDVRVVLGCPTSFHRDRVRIHYADAIARCCDEAGAASPEETSAVVGSAPRLEILTMREFSAAAGLSIETRIPEQRVDETELESATRAEMRKVAALTGRLAANSVNGASPMTSAPIQIESPAPAAPGAHARTARDRGDRVHSVVSEGGGHQGPQLRSVPTPRKSHKRASAVRNDAAPTERAVSADGSDVSRVGSARGGASQRDRRLEFELEGRPAQRELPFSFESFVVGPCNALAREAALALARQRQRALNQLYLGGESGMGKTHLARATAAEARRNEIGAGPQPPSGPRSPSRPGIVYTTAEQFTSEFVSAVRNGRSDEFKRRYRGPIGLLIVEDVQCFRGREKTQLELFHTVEHVLDAGGRVLLTGDRSPRDLGGLDERMRAQVGRGFVAELEPPDALIRRHILRAKAAAGGVHLPADCLDLLVESSEGSVRDIESVLIQVVTTSSLLGRAIDLDLTRDAVAMKSGAGSALAPKTIAVSEIVRLVAAFFAKRPEALASRSRRRDVLVPRQLAMYLAHRYTDASFTEIGRCLGRDHPAVRNAITRIERLALENAPIRYQVEALSQRVDQALKSQAGSHPALDQHERSGPRNDSNNAGA